MGLKQIVVAHRLLLAPNQIIGHLELHVDNDQIDNSSKKARRFPDMPFRLNLKIIPSCQTLSKALDISRKMARVSSMLSKSS